MNDHYYYGVGRVRSLEARLLTPPQLSRMESAADFQSAFAVLSETPYAENLPGLKEPFDFEELCGLELLSLKNLLDHLAPENEILKALFKKYDYLNAKILLRMLFSRTEKAESHSKIGTLDFDKLKLYIFEGIKEIDEKEILNAIDLARISFEQNKDPQLLDQILDKHYFTYLKQVCSASPSLLIKEMVDFQIDLINIKTLLRSRNRIKNKKRVEILLLDPGLLDKDILLGLLDKNLPEIISRLGFTPYLPAIAHGIERFESDPELLEKLMDDFIIERFRKAKYLSCGIEPLAGFYLAKAAEIRTLRFILVCKKNYVAPERIRERIGVSY